MSPSASPPGSSAVSYPAAELDRRFYAFALDRLVAWGLFAAAGYLAYVLFWHDGSTLAGVGVVVGAVLVVSLAFAVALGQAGVSPGMALVGLRVVRPADGRPVGVGRALLRTLVLGVATLPTLGLGLATLAWTAVVDPGGWRRGAHDRWSHAVVVDVRPVDDDVQDDEVRPRQIVNLTAMRLMPAPAVPVPVPVPAPAPAPAAARSATPAPTPVPTRPTSGAHAAPPSAPPAAPPARSPAPPAARPAAPPPAPPTPVTSAPPTPAAPAAPAAAGSSGPRPWRVSFDTGESFVVEGLALVGRRPEARSGEPVRHLVPLRSSDMSLSKTHAQFQVVPDGALVIMDRGSTNGSFVVRGGVSKALAAGRPSTLLDGDTVRLGDRTMKVARDRP